MKNFRESLIMGVLIGCFAVCVASCSAKDTTVNDKYITIDSADKYTSVENQVYYSSSSDTATVAVYYDSGVWVMYTDDVITNMQQYLVPDWDASIYDNVKDIASFDESTVTYYGYSADGKIFEVDPTKKFKELGVDFVFAEWVSGEHYYAYTFQSQDVSILNIYNDMNNLFRVYSEAAREALANGGTSENTATNGAETTVSVQEPQVEEVTTETSTEILDNDGLSTEAE